MTARRFLLTALAACMFLGPAPVSAQEAGEAAAVSLRAGAPAPDGSLRAGLDIRLEPGWKTYWINPGPAGFVPRLDVSGSDNLASATALWPAPTRFDDGDMDSIGYKGRVVVPLAIVPKDPSKPVAVRAKFDFGVCENICVPMSSELALTLPPGSGPDSLAAVEIRGFEARVPEPAQLGGSSGPLAVTAANREGEYLVVEARFPDGAASTDLFARAPGFSLGVPHRTGENAFRLKIKPSAEPRTIHLVAVADGRAVEVPVALDDLPARP